MKIEKMNHLTNIKFNSDNKNNSFNKIIINNHYKKMIYYFHKIIKKYKNKEKL